MDNPWQPSKCGSTCLSSAEPAVVVAPSPVSQVESHESSRNSMINPSHYYYAHVMQEPCSSTRKIVADPLFQATNINLYNSSLSGIGTSFFTLLSGLPASFSKYDSQHVLSSKPSHPSSKVHVYNSSPIAGPTECEASFGSPKISSQHFDNLYLKSKIDACPVVPVRTLASDGVNTASCLHDIVQARKVSDPSLKLAKAANYHTSHGIEQLNGFSSLKAAPTCGVTPVKSRELHSSSTPHQLSPLACGLPRVFCLYASGDLSLSSSGLLGVVCSCHGFHMSISKFSEHSGLQDVNPGDAVHTDSGETIAQWRKVYYSKFGIRIPEDQHGWHWPEGFTTAADLVKSSKRVPNVSKSSDLSKSFGPPRPFIPSKQPSNNMVFRNKHHSSQNMVNEIPCHEPEKNTHDNHELPNGFVHGGAANKIMEQLSNAFQSNPTYIDPIYKTKKPFTSQNHIQNLRSHGKDSDKFNNSRDGDVRERATVSSNIELRLGQPSQQGQTLGKSNPPGFPTPRFSRVAHPLELISSQPTLHNGSNRITEENKQFVDCAAQAAKISSTEGQNQLRFSNLGFAAYSSRTTHQPEQLKGDIVPGSVNSMLFSHLGNPKDKMQTKNSHLAFNHPKMIFSTDWAKHVDHGFSTPVSSGPRPPLLAGTSPRVFSSVGMNSSPNMTSTMSKEEATRVINPHTSSMRQGVRYLNQADVSSSCGFSKDQIVPGNSLKENVRSSITLPSKLKGRRDEYKLASQQSLPEHYGTTSWTAGGAEKSAMISGTSCAYIPDNCSCWVQRNTMIENSNLDGKNSVGAFGEPLEKGCIKIGETMKPNLKKVEFNAFQWKDVPSKDQKTKFLEGMIDVNEQTSGEKPVCMKEQVMSNISSKCSAPALTQASVKISNGDSCTDDAQNTGCAKNFAVDEGSGIQKSCSSDDALESGGNTGFNGFGCKTNLKNGTRSRVVPDRSTRSLIDELRVIDSLRLKKVQNQVHTGLPMTSSMKEFEPGKRKREMKFKVHATSFPVSSVSTESSGQSSQSLEDVHKLDKSTKELPCKTPKRVYEDFLEAPESSRGKKARLDLDFSKWKQKRITRPVVCGKYGLISNGDTSKPAKIFSLRKILKTAKRWDPDPPGNKVVKKPPEKVWATPITREGNRRSGRISNLKEDECQIGQKAVVVSDDDSMETSDSSYMLKKVSDSRNEISHGIPDNELGTRTWRKSKEVRIRSLHDLITKGKDSGVATMSKDIASVPQDNPNHGNSNNLTYKSTPDVDTFCHVCSGLNNDEMNCLLECNRCLIKVHQACYGISKVPKSQWFCRPCRENTTNMVCVLCGYEGGVMTRAVHTSNIVKTLLDAWKESQKNPIMVVLNSVTAGVFDPTVKQWVHMVCGLWTPGTRCPNVDTMSAFDVSGASNPDGNMVCSMCKRGGGCCIRCRVVDCSIHFHPWCAHQKGLLQSEVEGADNENVGFYGRCELHATKDHFKHKTNSLTSIQVVGPDEKETCARTEGYKGRKREGYRHDSRQNSLVRQEQVDAWNFINQLSLRKHLQRTTTTNTTTTQPVQDVEYDPRKEYARYKQSKGWKHLVVYKSGIHALGLYTSLFISQSEMVVEYVGEIVGLRVADRREIEYQSGKQLQYKSACYFFRIDKEHIIDATRKGGIARFVNHSCQPNCVAKVITVRGEKKVVFFAERDIYPGEEITYDYHFNNEDEGKKILCSCNSNNCRRYLN